MCYITTVKIPIAAKVGAHRLSGIYIPQRGYTGELRKSTPP